MGYKPKKILVVAVFATPGKQIRNTYRNYFKPHERIMFSGFRCALKCNNGFMVGVIVYLIYDI